jgi:hypothetical protein
MLCLRSFLVRETAWSIYRSFHRVLPNGTSPKRDAQGLYNPYALVSSLLLLYEWVGDLFAAVDRRYDDK